MPRLIPVLLLFALSSPNLPAQPVNGWYAFRPESSPEPGEIGLGDWIEKPAGKHGRITREGEALMYNERPIKLWGINLCFRNCAPSHDLADRRAAFYPKYGFNAVRLHKFADGSAPSGILSKESSAKYDPAGLERMDYQVAQFKKAGIYVELSAHFGTLSIGPADVGDVPYATEFGSFEEGKGRIIVPHSALFYSPEIQRLHIRQIVTLLEHRNPYTKLTYAEDPAICLIEIVNEQSILFWTSMAPLKKSPTLRRDVATRFCAWLRHKYGNEAGLIAAWGKRALNSFREDGFTEDESLDRGTIVPLGNPWHWAPEQINGEAEAYRRQRMLDTLEYLYGLQCETYNRYVAAVRAAGYDGELVGSNWQAGSGFSHFANLHSDALVGTIDRHNYFGGGKGALDGKPFNNRSMLARAGSGMLSSGLQQVADRPFMLSEWIHVFPNEWGVEGPAIIGAYGLGLQGWDASFLFENGDDARFSEVVGRDTWDPMAPQVLGVLPAVSRQVLRGDVHESDVVAPRKVHMPSLFQGRLGFSNVVKQGYDVKELSSSVVTARSLAAVRCVVEFTKAFEETPKFDLRPYLHDGFVESSTGQLRWKDAPDSERAGVFSIDTAGTKAAVGFAEGRRFELGEVTIEPDCPFASIYVTAQHPDRTIATDTKVLVVAMARARNTDMEFVGNDDRLKSRGHPPILLEPVKATITLRRTGSPRVILLDQDGRRTERTLPVEDGAFTIDGTRDQTPYYLIEY